MYRAIAGKRDTVAFWLSERRILPAATRFLIRALRPYGRPDRIVTDGSSTNRDAILSCDTRPASRSWCIRMGLDRNHLHWAGRR
ncbi:DDE-type integrase/transposase/recombinase [Microvirga zambiensis]|uniref:DDE-type integrase/transposase/recombinase n=1 Tax=Microvirga zambiensis TaxID=1402137 RepID=UPI00191CBA69